MPRDKVLTDFLRSNDAVESLRERIMESIVSRAGETPPEIATFAEARLTNGVLGVREGYLETAHRVIAENYGDLNGFLRTAGGVSEEDVARTRKELLG